MAIYDFVSFKWQHSKLGRGWSLSFGRDNPYWSTRFYRLARKTKGYRAIDYLRNPGEWHLYVFKRFHFALYRAMPIIFATMGAIKDIGYDGKYNIEAFKTSYKGVPKWLGSRKHEIWYVIIHHWKPTNKSWKKHPSAVATRIHNLLAQAGYSARVELRRD